jgi:hypothetical protein
MVCGDCGTEEAALHYRSGRMKRCYDCQAYVNLTVKSKAPLPYDREAFVAWKRSDPSRRLCSYCGLDAPRLHALGIVNVRTKKVYESIGLDRIDNEQGYELANLRPCCGPCNAIRSTILRPDEMERLGLLLADIWAERGETSTRPPSAHDR